MDDDDEQEARHDMVLDMVSDLAEPPSRATMDITEFIRGALKRAGHERIDSGFGFGKADLYVFANGEEVHIQIMATGRVSRDRLS